MSDYRVVYERAGGGMAILTPIAGCGLTLAQIIEKDVPRGASYAILDASEIPSDRSNRDKWKLINGKIVTNHASTT